jgi:SAM-dependent methyltransferase
MSLTLDQLEYLRTDAAADLLAMELSDDPLHAILTLRKRCGPDEAAAVAELRELRTRAQRGGRFPQSFARQMLATDKLLQQASSFRLAVWKGRRFAERFGGDAEVIDLCCGFGADAIGLAAAGLSVRGVDVSAEAVVCAAHNAAAAGVGDRCRFEVADATRLDLPASAVVHIDPDRRASGRRSVELADHRPGEAMLRELARTAAAGAMKLSAALPHREAEELPVGELEYVSESGTCRQLVAWWSRQRAPRPPRRRATVVWGPPEAPESASLAAGQAPRAATRPPGEWLIEPDPAVLAAGGVDDLAAAEGLWRIDRALVWLFADRPIASPLAHCFHILDAVPGRQRDVARAVRRLRGGIVEVKPRGVKLDTDALQRHLRGRGSRPLAVLWYRVGEHQRAFICEREAAGTS